MLHNATQDLVKVFVRVFTNNIAAGFKATEAKTSRAILGRAGKRESRDRLDLFSLPVPLSALHPPGAASERCGRRHPLLFTFLFPLLFNSHPDLCRRPGPLAVLPGHPQHPARQAGRDARDGLPVPCVHAEEADCAEPPRQRCRSGSKHAEFVRRLVGLMKCAQVSSCSCLLCTTSTPELKQKAKSRERPHMFSTQSI